MAPVLSFLRRAPRVAEPEPDGRPFAFAVHDEPRGWMVTAYGADGRRLGRPLKAMSSAGRETLLRSLDGATEAELELMAAAWVRACRHAMTNAAVLTSFLDTASAIQSRGDTTASG